MKVRRVFGTAPAEGVCAGSMDSRKGNARVTPLPRRKVLRDKCFFVMKFMMRSPCEWGNLSNYHPGLRPPLLYQEGSWDSESGFSSPPGTGGVAEGRGGSSSFSLPAFPSHL